MLQVITPAGDRHESWALSQLCMESQLYPGPVRWIVIDDGRQPLCSSFDRCNYFMEVHRLPPIHGNSQSRNMLHAISLCDPRIPVVCWEDDDHYTPAHLQVMAEALGRFDLVGQRVSYYYNIQTRRQAELPGTRHASLGASAMQGPALAMLRDICARAPASIDLALWRDFRGSKALLEGRTAVGIKGMPGRGGIGIGHRDTFGDPDPGGNMLRKWVGEHAGRYLELRR